MLDAVAGDHAAGIRVALFRLDGQGKIQLFDVMANEQGRIAETVAEDAILQSVQYELVFHAADYFKAAGFSGDKPLLSEVVVRIHLEPQAKVHMPLVLSPHSYTLWWSQ